MSGDNGESSLRSAPAQSGVKRPHNVAVNLKGLNSLCVQSRPKLQKDQKLDANPPTASQSAFTLFRQRRRMEYAERNETLTNQDAWKEWGSLPAEKRKLFEREVREQREKANNAALSEAREQQEKANIDSLSAFSYAPESSNGTMLQALREQETRKAEVTARTSVSSKPLSEVNETQKAKRCRKKEPVEEIQMLVFPQRRSDSAPSCTDKTGRRHEIFEAIKESTKNVSVAPSHEVSLHDVRARLQAPTLSCDWQRRASSDSEAEDCGLEVEMPAGTSARECMEDDMQRRISAAKVRRLIK